MPDSNTVLAESVLIQRAGNGDTDAFGALYLLYLDAIYRYIFYRVGDVHDAEDLTEHVFLKAWEALPGYKQRGHPFSSWLYRIAHNVVIDYKRRRKNIVPLSESDDKQWRDPQANPLRQVILSETEAALLKAVSQLPEEQQQVIILRFIEGLSHAEVAHILEKSDGACRMIQHRALNALNKRLASYTR